MSSASAEGSPTALHAPRRAGTSIALRLTCAYALFTFTLVLLTSALLYLTLANGLYDEDVRDLADNLNNARLLVEAAGGSWTPSPQLERPGWAPPQQPQIYLRLMDSQGRVLTETPGMGAALARPSALELKQLRSPGVARRELRSPSGEPYLSLLVPVQRAAPSGPLFMQVAMDREHDEGLLVLYRGRLWLIFGACLLLCSAAGYLIAHAGLRPLQSIASTAARIRSSTLYERIQTAGLPAELAGLAATFNSMLDRLEQSFAHISQFSDDVAHELRTPVNNLRGEIEVALAKPRTAEDYSEILVSCLEECRRIGRLIQTLLFLARADASASALVRESVDVAAELATVDDYYGAAAADAGVSLTIRCPAALKAPLNRTLFQQAVGNLVSNAIAHTPAGGRVTVSADAAPGHLLVRVSDTGCGIAPQHLPQVFERFYRVDPARGQSSQNVGSHPGKNAGQHVGLGLAVVRSIATRHGGSVGITSEIGRGTEVRLLLPS